MLEGGVEADAACLHDGNLLLLKILLRNRPLVAIDEEHDDHFSAIKVEKRLNWEATRQKNRARPTT